MREHGRAIVLIGFGLAVVAASVVHALTPLAQPSAHPNSASIATAPKAPAAATQRPYGVLHIDDVWVTAPEMQAFERAFLESLLQDGFTVTDVEPGPWDSRLDQAHADLVRTNLGDLTVIAPDGPEHPLWICPRSIAAVSGQDVPAYEISAGGDRITISVGGLVYAGRVGDVLVLTQQAAVWQQLSPIVSPATCPG
ncbi:MAG TPA: hypothetical protein VF160_11940 [Candidatus Dormibacteraeota bacterium]